MHLHQQAAFLLNHFLNLSLAFSQSFSNQTEISLCVQNPCCCGPGHNLINEQYFSEFCLSVLIQDDGWTGDAFKHLA